jgi:hypothetical protein
MVKGAIEMYETTMEVQPGLRIPLQAAPIDRSPAGAAAFGSEAGVDASIDWGALAQQAIPLLGGLASSFL